MKSQEFIEKSNKKNEKIKLEIKKGASYRIYLTKKDVPYSYNLEHNAYTDFKNVPKGKNTNICYRLEVDALSQSKPLIKSFLKFESLQQIFKD